MMSKNNAVIANIFTFQLPNKFNCSRNFCHMQLSHRTAMMKIPLILWLMILSNLLILWLLLCRFEKLIFPHFKEMTTLNVLSNTTVSVMLLVINFEKSHKSLIWSTLFMHSYIFCCFRLLSLLQRIVLLNFRRSSLGYSLKNIK